MRAHSRSHLPANDRPFSCTYEIGIMENYSTSELISTQRAAVTNHGTSSSKICGQKFWTAQHLRAHELAIHLGEKPYKVGLFIKCRRSNPMIIFQCASCSASFAKHGALRTHEAEVHSPPGTKPYRCEHTGCSQSFATNQKLKTHARVHDSELVLA